MALGAYLAVIAVVWRMMWVVSACQTGHTRMLVSKKRLAFAALRLQLWGDKLVQNEKVEHVEVSY